VSQAARRERLPESLFEEEALGKAYDARLLVQLWRYVAPYRFQVATTIALLIPLLAVELAPAWIVKTGLDRVIVPAAGVPVESLEAAPGADPPASSLPGLRFLAQAFARVLDAPAGFPPLLWLGFVYLIVAAAGSMVHYLDELVMSRTGQAAMRDLRRHVFAHIQSLHLAFFDTVPVGRLVTRATNDVENVSEMFSAGIVALIRDVIKMLAIAVVLFNVDARLALYTFAVVPLLAVVAIVFRFKARQAFRLVRVRIARINAYLQENVTGMKVVQLFTRERRNFREFDEMNASHRDAWLHSIRYDAALYAVVEFAFYLAVAIVIWRATEVAAAGTIYLFVEYVRRFFMPLRDLSAKYSVMQSSMASAERIFQLLDTQPAVADASDAAAVPEQGDALGSVEFANVWFAYGAESDGGAEPDWVLRDVSFRVEPGERVAFVGATGAGKTTIIKLLTRFYDPTRGRILIDGVELPRWPLAALRRRVAMVLQDPFLFSGSIRDNISLERADLDAARVESVARAVQAHGFIDALAAGYDTRILERGVNLSAGQRQLLSFARALAHGADILVLDEATSSIDTETEVLVQRGIHALIAKKTALVIAHRLSTIQDVDRIYVLHKGCIVESGPHEALLAQGGIYTRLYRMQVAHQRRGVEEPGVGRARA
jgi:ABC-type multidrug transport system fused ATPase/permease subunit